MEQSGDGTAVAIWINRRSPDAPKTFQRDSAEAVGPHLARLTLLEAKLYEAQPKQAHWWLAFLGVLPAARGRGHGASLLYHAAGWQGRSMAYLEATSHRLTGYYARCGYASGPPVRIPEGPVIRPMWTRPDSV